MWTYQISSGKFFRPDNDLLTEGYSGFGECKNNADMQHLESAGPIPEGIWYIHAPRDTAEHGPVVMPLTPLPGTETYGRSGFLIHGDSIKHPGEASHGCIIVSRTAREQIAASDDKELRVIR